MISKLTLKWSKKENDLIAEGANRWDVNFIMGAMTREIPIVQCSLLEELENRGYDITTLKFSIKPKETYD